MRMCSARSTLWTGVPGIAASQKQGFPQCGMAFRSMIRIIIRWKGIAVNCADVPGKSYPLSNIESHLPQPSRLLPRCRPGRLRIAGANACALAVAPPACNHHTADVYWIAPEDNLLAQVVGGDGRGQVSVDQHQVSAVAGQQRAHVVQSECRRPAL